jgi:hypothetical protein
MSKMDADLRQRETLRKQVGGACMAQAVRTVRRDCTPQPLESFCDDVVKTAMSEGSARRVHTEKNLPMLSEWSHFTDVPGCSLRQ